MNVFQRSGSGVDLEPLIFDDMGLSHVEFRHAAAKPATARRATQPWQCSQGRGEHISAAEQPTAAQILKRLLGGVVAILVVALAWHGTARADTVGLHIGSVHVPQREYSNANPGAFYRHDSGLMAGVFRNSLGRVSVYGAYQFPVGPVDVAVGLVNGYKQKCWTEEVNSREVRPDGAVITSKGFKPKCQGTGRHEWMPMVVPSYAFAPVAGFGVVPRLSLMLSERTTAIALSFEKEL